MDWTWFYRFVAVFTLIYALWDMRPMRGRQYLFGAEIFMGVVILSELSRKVSQDISPVLLYSMIDTGAVTAFVVIMFRNRAVWAASCVMFHTAMLITHLLFFVAGQGNQTLYLWLLGALTVAVALAINIGTMAGRHEFGQRWDRFVHTHIRGWSWSGALTSRLCDYKKEVG